MRVFNDNSFRGLYFSTINHSEVNADLEGVAEGDYFSSAGIGSLIYYSFGFKILTNNLNHYLTKEDLKCKFINLRIENKDLVGTDPQTFKIILDKEWKIKNTL